MNKRITLNQLLLASSCLLLTSTQVLADRPAMDDRSETFEPEVIDISTDVEAIPVFEEMPAQETTSDLEEPVLETIPGMEGVSAVDESQMEPAADDVEPVIHVYDHRTETEITSDVIELQAGETLPIKVLDFPRRGMKMEKVKNELGEPLEISDTIGKPPITTWTYNDRVVYFEYSSVVHVVAAD
ncbi:MAG: hypothetical protein KAJ92_01710 [Gammaproteobacteria bacterium]|nr:hypothetical protein [Gammaproteobacteria bacterium]